MRDCTISVAKTKTLISCAVTAQLICIFCFLHVLIVCFLVQWLRFILFLLQFVRKPTSAPMYYTNFKRDKISSPTVDSTTDNIIQLFPGRASATSQRSESSLEGSMTSQGFRPIQESQESGIKTETQTTVGDTVFHGISSMIIPWCSVVQM